ncbi:MAG: ABC transporter ATP-binding protein [Gammaproteobacteria bacterium]|nr:MAG: ABC transporter ATP-binding protein [Gammaproteobacteria bacterium]
MARGPLIQLRNVSKSFVDGQTEHRVLENVSLDITDGETVAITGESGSGKSTLLSILGLLDLPTEGEYRLRGKRVNELTYKQLALIRNRYIGWVFQNFSLINHLSALQNVILPLRLGTEVPKTEYVAMAEAALAKVGLGDKMHHLPSQLSGGQQQRVALARAIVTRPSVIFADEPTGNLDEKNSEQIMALLFSLVADGTTLVLVSHEPRYARQCQRILTIRQGRLEVVNE